MDFLAMKVLLEESVMQAGVLATAGSKMLSDFVAPFDAEVVTRLKEAKVPIAGRTAMEEFGIDSIMSLGEPNVCPAVEAVADGEANAALGNDFSGKMRRCAPKSGVYYIHPTYGTVSRYGLMPMISSMDQIGVVCKDVQEGFALLSLIAGKDEKDGAMFDTQSYTYAADHKDLRIWLPGNALSLGAQSDQAAALAFAQNFECVSSDLKYFEVYSQVLYILGSAEICNNTNRYDGIKMGYRAEDFRTLNELYIKSRSEAFGLDLKLTAMMGAFVLSKSQYTPYYEKAMKLRRLIKESLEFDKYDVIVLPAQSEGDPYQQTALYALPTLAGLPSLSMPYQGGSIQLIANTGNENALYSAWEVVNREV